MQITVNGEAREVPADLSLEQLLVDLKIPGREGVAVALNLRVVRRQERQGLQLSEGDRIDIVTAVGGG
ncbi:MAG: thiamine biosynthesis protein ThiS [Rickettsiales bacterium]|nr:thiamine biosynthesis protein ThiS [Rickettsiales bacterium]